MNNDILKILNEAEGRYLTSEEESKVLELSSEMSSKLKAMKNIEIKEKSIVENTVDTLREKYPTQKEIPDSRDKCIRDVTLTLRYCTNAMLRDNSDYLKDKLLYWLRTILHSLEFDKGVIKDTYVMLDENCKKDLSEKSYDLLKPYTQTCIDVLS